MSAIGDNPKIKFGESLRSLRISQSMTLRDLEEKTGISNSYLSQLEGGKRDIPGIKVLGKLIEVYGSSIWDILKESGAITSLPKGLSDPDPDLYFIISGYKQLTQEDKGMFKDWMRFKLKEETNKKLGKEGSNEI